MNKKLIAALKLLPVVCLGAGVGAMVCAIAASKDFADVVDKPWFLWIFRATVFAVVVSFGQLVWREFRAAGKQP